MIPPSTYEIAADGPVVRVPMTISTIATAALTAMRDPLARGALGRIARHAAGFAYRDLRRDQSGRTRTATSTVTSTSATTTLARASRSAFEPSDVCKTVRAAKKRT